MNTATLEQPATAPVKQSRFEALRPYRTALRAAGITEVAHEALHTIAASDTGQGVVGASNWADLLPRTAVPLVRAGLLEVVYAWPDTGRPRLVRLSAAGQALVEALPLPPPPSAFR